MTRRRKLPPITSLAHEFERLSGLVTAGREGLWVTVLWYPSGAWFLSMLGAAWFFYDVEHRGLIAQNVWVPARLARPRYLAMDVRDFLKDKLRKAVEDNE